MKDVNNAMDAWPIFANASSCESPSINEFPTDFLTQEQRLQGGVILHFLIVIYACAMMVIVCESYFMPALQVICNRFNISADVSGATLMAIGSSSTELFTSITGLFVAKSNIGVSTVLGSAVFNFLGVTSIAGLSLKRKKINLDWYPVTRETLIYIVCVAALVATVVDGKVHWWEGVLMTLLYFAYVTFVILNPTIQEYFNLNPLFGCCESGNSVDRNNLVDETDGHGIRLPYFTRKSRKRVYVVSSDEIDSAVSSEMDEQPCPWSMPNGNRLIKIIWVILWPAMFLFAVTIPDARKPADRKFVPIAFVMCLVWIGITSYICVWMVTIIGYTLSIPDEIAGLTILAAGVSVPEIIFGVYGVQQGEANMVLSTQVGSNIFDILICLGLPWAVSGLAFSENGTVDIESPALVFTVVMLLAVTILFWVTLWISRWILDWKVGLLCLVFYLAFVIICCLYQFNVIGDLKPEVLCGS